MKTVAAFCTRTSPPPNGMFSTMALLRMIMATETVVVAMHAAANVAVVGVSSCFCVSTSTITSSVFFASMAPGAHACAFMVMCALYLNGFECIRDEGLAQGVADRF